MCQKDTSCYLQFCHIKVVTFCLLFTNPLSFLPPIESPKAYQSAWDQLVERKQERQILQIKLESVGILVDDPEIERPLIETAAEETE